MVGSASTRLTKAASRVGQWAALYLQDRRRGRALVLVPGAPQNLSGADMSTYIQLRWALGLGTVTGQRIYRNVDGGSYSLWQTVGGSTAQVQDLGVVIGHTYGYYLVAYNSNGDSAPSNVATVGFEIA